MEQVWNGHGTDTLRNVFFEVLHSLVWNGGVRNQIRGPVPSLGWGLDWDVRFPLFRTNHTERLPYMNEAPCDSGLG